MSELSIYIYNIYSILCLYYRKGKTLESYVYVTSCNTGEESQTTQKRKHVTLMTHLQPVDQFLLYCVLSCSISGYT